MGDDNAVPRPLANLMTEAKEGRLRVRMEPEEFVYLDRDCEFFKDQIQQIQLIMDKISRQDRWGLGEDYQTKDGKRLVSGETMVSRFRKKARSSDNNDNSVYAVMESHYNIVEDIQNMFRAIREQFSQADSAWAARYTDLEANLPQQQPAPQRMFSFPFPRA
ncbi:hypothetical protein [Nocardia sp. NPDC049707]|uniref:hypothetical protein n=1 Tax=Nocardia sp. NPDC049707 TaxID=3154735 RepID=UPI00344AC4CA